MTLANVILVLAGTLTGLMAGLSYGFTVAVIPGLRDLKPKEHITAMQAINIRILNPLFAVSFVGPGVLLPLAAFLHRGGASFPWLLAAAALYIVGVFGITGGGNVPLNNRLAQVSSDTLTEAEAEQVRQDYHGRGSGWMWLHNLRTLAAIAATALVLIACLQILSA
jgi:uncharacterized membrane protein